MRRVFIFAVLAAGTLASIPALYKRLHQEQSQRQVALLVDWKEVRDLANREMPSPIYLLQALHEAGIQGVLFSPLTLKEAIRGDESALVHPVVSFEHAALGHQAFDELTRRGVTRLEAGDAGDHVTLTRPAGDFSGLGDVEIGYDENLLALSRDQGLALFLRVNQDPWLQAPDPLPADVAGVIFTSDDPPGGLAALPAWTAQLRTQGIRHLLVEFKPTRAAVTLARAIPGLTLRTHTIPTAELKDLTQAQELSRWLRAVRERNCRCLLFRPSPSDSWISFQTRLDLLRRLLLREGWVLALPAVQPTLKPTRSSLLLARLGMAFGIATLAPLLGLGLARARQGWGAFFTVAGVAVIGGMLAAAIAYGPETRLEIVPFRGIKAAIMISWLGSLALLYPFQEWRWLLLRPLTRMDLMLSLLILGVIGYSVVRSGNSTPSWRSGSEQGVRDYLEKTLEVRPRFKEFAMGYPLLLVGFLVHRRNRKRKIVRDSRPLIALGMMGPISTVNTFCHLHSPLNLAFMRSGLGILLGSMVGITIYSIACFFEGDTA